MSFFEIVRQPHFSPYKMYIRRDLGFVVCLNPKVGSTAFRKTLVEGLKMIGAKPLLGKLWPVSEKRRYMTAPPNHYFHAFKHPGQYEFHCFVRNPYKRVLSAWNDKLVKGFHSEQYPRSMRKLVPRIRLWAGQNKLKGSDESAPLPFATFLSYVESQAEGQRNQHWDTQRSVLVAEKINYTHIHQMEIGFSESIADVLEKLSIPRDWVLEKLARPTNASGVIADTVLNHELADRVYELYKDDFELFGYDRNSWQGL